MMNFKNKIIAILIMSLAFVFGMNAQNQTCHPTTCFPFSNNDLLQVYEAVKESASTPGTGTRQSTQDSIKRALYYTNAGGTVTAANLLNSINVSATSLPIIAANTSTITVAATFTTITTAGTNTVASGARLVSVYNSSSTNSATLQGNTLPPLTGITFQYPNAILPNITYNCLAATLLIQILR